MLQQVGHDDTHTTKGNFQLGSSGLTGQRDTCWINYEPVQNLFLPTLPPLSPTSLLDNLLHNRVLVDM